MSNNTERYEASGALLSELLPEDFTDLIGAMFLVGFNYQIDHSRPEEFVKRVEVTGYRVDSAGSQIERADSVQTVWEFRGEWVCIEEETGLVKTTKAGPTLKPRTPDQLITWVQERINEWEFAPVTDESEESGDEVIEEDGDDAAEGETETSEDSTDEVETPQIEAPKAKRGSRASK